jgi:F-type H+-transporting ATPase subunit epsilon
MAHNKFPTRILTPEGEVFNGEVEMVSTRTTVGLIGVMANHAPLLATLEPTELRLHTGDGEITRYAQSEGYLQVGGNQALLLLEEVHPADELNAEDLRERLRKAEEDIAAAGENTEMKRAALQDKRRWETFLKIVG